MYFIVAVAFNLIWDAIAMMFSASVIPVASDCQLFGCCISFLHFVVSASDILFSEQFVHL
jgi:hypothetical protein